MFSFLIETIFISLCFGIYLCKLKFPYLNGAWVYEFYEFTHIQTIFNTYLDNLDHRNYQENNKITND